MTEKVSQRRSTLGGFPKGMRLARCRNGVIVEQLSGDNSNALVFDNPDALINFLTTWWGLAIDPQKIFND